MQKASVAECGYSSIKEQAALATTTVIHWFDFRAKGDEFVGQVKKRADRLRFVSAPSLNDAIDRNACRYAGIDIDG